MLRGQTIQRHFRCPRPQTAPAAGSSRRVPRIDRFRQTGTSSARPSREILERRARISSSVRPIRTEILSKLIAETPFDLPADLVAAGEVDPSSAGLDLRRRGLSDAEIRAREAETSANAHESTLRSLKEFFVLAKIAEAENIKVEDEDLEIEIEAIAARSDETSAGPCPDREGGLADALASQILERKTIDRILEYVTLEEVPLVEDNAVETLDQAAPRPAEGLRRSEAAESTVRSECGRDRATSEPSRP